jgi:hypothetical protein
LPHLVARAAAAGCKTSAAVDCHLKTTTLFTIGYLRSVLPIADATLFSGSITTMATGRGVAKGKLANGAGFCRNCRHVDGSQAERQHAKLENKFFRVHISSLLSNEKILALPGRRRDYRRVNFFF